MKKSTLIIATLSTLAGCGSFNNSFNHYPDTLTLAKEAPVEPVVMKEIVVQAPKVVETKNVNLCPPFQMPVMPKTPELPFPNPSVMDRMSLSEIEKAERDHIDQLRAFISDYKTELRKAHVQYLVSCSGVSKP